jgi:cytidylate kinase
VRRDLAERDRQDRERALAPLRRPPDAIGLDASALTAAEVVAAMTRAVQERRACCTHR